MEQNVNYYKTQEQVNHSCLNPTTCNVSHSILCQNLLQKTQRIQVGSGQFVIVLFIIPVNIDVHSHRFEIYTLVSEIHGRVDLVLGLKCVQVGRGNKLTGLLFQISEQLPTHFPKRVHCFKTQGTENDKSKSSIHR